MTRYYDSPIAEGVIRNVAKNLQYLRSVQGISKTSLSALINISRKKYTAIEQGKVFPDLLTVCILADYFHISLMNLILYDLEKECKEIYCHRHG